MISAQSCCVVHACRISSHSARRLRAAAERREIGVVEEIGALDHQQQTLEHVRGVGVETDPSVSRRLDRRRLEVAAHRRQRRPARHVMREVAERRRRDGIHLGDGEIEIVADARYAARATPHRAPPARRSTPRSNR